MLIQIDTMDGREVYLRVLLFEPNNDHALCELHACKDRDQVDAKLKRLNLRRRGQWEKTEWGWEAKLRKIR